MNSVNRKILFFTLLAAMLVASSMTLTQANVGPTTTTYAINVEYLGVNYPEVLILNHIGGSITGGSLDLAGGSNGNSYFDVTGGSINGANIVIVCVKGSLTVTLTGTVGEDGSMSGSWADTLGGSRTGTWFIGTLIPAPEYMLGALAALGSCFVGFAIFKKRSSLPHLNH